MFLSCETLEERGFVPAGHDYKLEDGGLWCRPCGEDDWLEPQYVDADREIELARILLYMVSHA